VEEFFLDVHILVQSERDRLDRTFLGATAAPFALIVDPGMPVFHPDGVDITNLGAPPASNAILAHFHGQPG
jgi:hypothetical protein